LPSHLHCCFSFQSHQALKNEIVTKKDQFCTVLRQIQNCARERDRLCYCWQGCQTSFEKKKPNLVQKKPNGVKKSQIAKNHEISAFSMCYHVFSKVVNKANGTVTDYAHGNLKFRHFQCITFASRSLNNFEGSFSCWWNFPPMFLGFFSWFIKLLTTVPWYNCSVA